jgi:hypothetical protein
MKDRGDTFLFKGLISLSFMFPLSSMATTDTPKERRSVQADARPLNVKSFDGAVSVDSNSQYYQTLGQFEQLHSAGQKEKLVSRPFFQSLSWIGRTACINYVCGMLPLGDCRQVLELGLSDEALVVRDHALRITISTSYFSALEKKTASERVIGDSRNYRKGRPFWIVDRAREYLVADSGESPRR